MTRRPGSDRSGGESLVGRWSRLKRAREAGELPAGEEAPGEAVPAGAESGAEVQDDRPDEEILAELGLPEPEALGPDDDFSAFLKARLPERLRQRVLRRLWRVDPVLANLDELLDYGEDFTDAAVSAGVVQTVYEVGRGMLAKAGKAGVADSDDRPDESRSASVSEAPGESRDGGDREAGAQAPGSDPERAADAPGGAEPEPAEAAGRGEPEGASGDAGGEGEARAAGRNSPGARHRRARIRFQVPES